VALQLHLARIYLLGKITLCCEISFAFDQRIVAVVAEDSRENDPTILLAESKVCQDATLTDAASVEFRTELVGVFDSHNARVCGLDSR
jgi:hypothetical protein